MAKETCIRGFTLLELIVVMVILGVLVTIVAPNFLEHPDKARVTTTKIQIEMIAEALELYRLDNRRYPTTEEGLEVLVSTYLKKLPSDPWDMPYQYIHPGAQGDYDLYSFGADGKSGGTGVEADIGNWE